ncbi:hypothetical protein NADFUDRAFT_51707 [Nadsonia fulvescens var. elongata DSM 6958]|uniref:Uncharacterized protein n=1 Tax=Nadsonia fulvescens var. elongata DSM 6958 TaxID=857566 RepID=A0A1E3PIC1_9ASCO|nr:hypothetical protein NADFUDRAFT_51707 [Nadsonia fulvescens var. elongata DSM 6958]
MLQKETRYSICSVNYACLVLALTPHMNNSWQAVVLPLAHAHPVLFHALAALTLIHTARTDADRHRRGQHHIQQSIELLAREWASGGLRDDVALATTLALT